MDKNNIVNLLMKSQIATIEEIQGCSENEIKELEEAIGHSFPNMYRNFLLEIGHRAGLLFQGTDIFFGSIKGLTEEANELLEENQESFNLPEDAFVFSMHQGYEFNYFRFSEGDNPPVYQYIEGEGEPKLAWDSFSSFLSDGINITSKFIRG
ncbi:SMI1/KNR4 family protein [Metabacillus fastidiosus]|uniref:SMI1/KNR4 family protein n=1 Tax=Metabacillus fastidiosus TaxID=1458 RepID=UPI002E1A876B|nr:SMI1/KNR4 family protein [Metabacillus fastidiosus]